MIKSFQTRQDTGESHRPTRWLVDRDDAACLDRLEQSTLSAMVAGCSPEDARIAIVRSLAGDEVPLGELEPVVRKALVRMLNTVREAANADIDPELVATVCTDAMDVGLLLRQAFTQGFDAGRGVSRPAAVVH